jgi:DNA-binding transcriptional ArsR family regulator
MKQLKAINNTVSLFKIFSDQTRLRIIELLSKGEFCVQDISKKLHVSQSAISHQLATLREQNIVLPRKNGKHVFYALKDDHILELFNIGYTHANECD